MQDDYMPNSPTGFRYIVPDQIYRDSNCGSSSMLLYYCDFEKRYEITTESQFVEYPLGLLYITAIVPKLPKARSKANREKIYCQKMTGLVLDGTCGKLESIMGIMFLWILAVLDSSCRSLILLASFTSVVAFNYRTLPVFLSSNSLRGWRGRTDMCCN
jgi:hypothetical protein